MNSGPTASQWLSDTELAFLFSVMGVAPRQLQEARKTVTDRYRLGPRGAWMLGMIKVGIDSPSALAERSRVGRSLVTTELNRLLDAGLITSRKESSDARRLKLSLTPEGEAASDQLAADMAVFASERLKAYTREEVLLCARILRDFSGGAPQFTDMPDQE
jgi:DNA-binding MarR family transcriptional regulator